MANVYSPIQQHIPFPNQPVAHSPSPLGFGFGLHGFPSSSLPSPAHHHPLAQSPSAPRIHVPPRQSTKRRHEVEEDAENDGSLGGDTMMNTRSPSPLAEKPKRMIAKRLRVAQTETAKGKSVDDGSSGQDDNIDVGVLLASLPPQSLLPLLNSVLSHQPNLKPLIISLIPRPTLETALQAVATAARKVRDAYPYSQPNTTPSLSFGFGSANSPHSSHSASHMQNNGGMREPYIRSRLRPSVAEFVSTALSYLSYFSSTQAPAPAQNNRHATAPAPPQHSPPHPSETFTYLYTLVSNIQRLPPLARSLIYADSPQLAQRLAQEWSGWVNHVDQEVNQRGGMFSGEVAQGWERALDEMVNWEERDRSENSNAPVGMKIIRDRWVNRVGWLIGKHAVNAGGMDEDEL
ncbi:hypothetical protein BOTBODRAFT_26696 [Botryobasidium botryosum FD-172 SS1]|uniref:Tethering factor for nuclear proteasome STS1 n=1 Tax=Botryobasidium botryosum (strain FD-172 SS1) TaxID=930990 RepID=A0A067N149_BOTB1|nr:hypothetical protein BOTBODRAFT_26696 [Botryobasidium botryosum FD-172 SS1]